MIHLLTGLAVIGGLMAFIGVMTLALCLVADADRNEVER